MSRGARSSVGRPVALRLWALPLWALPLRALPLWALPVWALVCTLATPSVARAFGVELDSDASFQAYEVRARGASVFVARRRLVSNLSLRLTEAFTEPDAEGRRIRFTATGRLRLEHDFGEDCLVERELCVRATDPTDLGGWQPLAASTRVDVPLLWAEVSGLPYGVEARVGRMLEIDPTGFLRVDGGRIVAAPWSFLSLETSAGMVVRRTSIAGTSAFDPQGSLRIALSDDDALRASWVAPASDTFTVQGTLRANVGPAIAASVGVRQTWDGDGTVLRRAWLSLSSQPIEILRMEASGVLDLLSSTVVDAVAHAALAEDAWNLRLTLEHHVPRFDPGTIWAWFYAAPIQELSLGGSYRFGSNAIELGDVELGAALRGRHADLGADDLGQGRNDFDAGGEGWLRTRILGCEISATGFVWSGSLGPLAGLGLDVARRFLTEFALELHVSLWHFDDPNRPALQGLVVSEALDGVIQIGPETEVVVELQHAGSDAGGHRFRFIGLLRVETWR
jgi:hypothetical protein